MHTLCKLRHPETLRPSLVSVTRSLVSIIILCSCSSSKAEIPAEIATRIASRTTSLQQVVVDFPHLDIPPDASENLFALKQDLRQLVEAVLLASPADQPPDRIRDGMVKALQDAGVQLGRTDHKPILEDIRAANPGLNEDTRFIPYGDILEIMVAQPEAHLDLIVAAITIAVECGNDTSLYIWRRSGDTWTSVLASNAEGYKDISGAQWEFQYKISPKRPDGSFVVVTGNITPWCTSNWRSVRYTASLILPRRSAEVLANGKLGMFCCEYMLEATTDGFSLTRYDSDPDPDRAGFLRPFQVRYALERDNARLLPDQTREEDLQTYRELISRNARFYKPLVAETLTALADSYVEQRQFEKQQQALREAVEVYSELAQLVPIYRGELASTLTTLAHSYWITRNREEEEKTLLRLLPLHRELVTAKYWRFTRSNVAETLNELADLYRGEQRVSEAKPLNDEAVAIARELWQLDADRNGDLLARTLLTAIELLPKSEAFSACALAQEAGAARPSREVKKDIETVLDRCSTLR